MHTTISDDKKKMASSRHDVTFEFLRHINDLFSDFMKGIFKAREKNNYRNANMHTL